MIGFAKFAMIRFVKFIVVWFGNNRTWQGYRFRFANMVFRTFPSLAGA
jgi:hypothetical protein